MRVSTLIVGLLVAGAAFAQDVTIQSVIGEKPPRVDAVLGKPLSIGTGGTFREYGTARSSWYVKFDKGVAIAATVTLRKPFTSPVLALKGIGIKVGATKPAQKSILRQTWLKTAGFRSIEVQSLDGKLWETIEVTQ